MEFSSVSFSFNRSLGNMIVTHCVRYGRSKEYISGSGVPKRNWRGLVIWIEKYQKKSCLFYYCYFDSKVLLQLTVVNLIKHIHLRPSVQPGLGTCSPCIAFYTPRHLAHTNCSVEPQLLNLLACNSHAESSCHRTWIFSCSLAQSGAAHSHQAAKSVCRPTCPLQEDGAAGPTVFRKEEKVKASLLLQGSGNEHGTRERPQGL